MNFSMSTLKKEDVLGASIDLDPLVEGGQRYYDEHLRDTLEPEQTGRYVAIDPATGQYFIGDTGTEALLEAHRAFPQTLFYLARVGYLAADTLSGYGRRAR
jgi:hypothetical protein